MSDNRKDELRGLHEKKKRVESSQLCDVKCLLERIVKREEQKSMSPSQKKLKRKSNLNQGESRLQSMCKEGSC